MQFNTHMELALSEARAAAKRGEVPVGAVAVDPQGRVVAAEPVKKATRQHTPRC